MIDRELWNLVNNCQSHEGVAFAEKCIKDSDVDNDTYNDLMMALTYISRDLYSVG